MPELPEIEVTRRLLRTRLRGHHVEDAHLKREGKTTMPGAEALPELRGRPLEELRRFGKILVFEFGDLSLAAHLMLIGRIALFPGGRNIPVEPRLRLTFAEGEELEVRFVAARSLALLPTRDLQKYPAIAKQGPDALEISGEQFDEALRQVRGPVKNVFMEQERIAGIGNAYADEILFDARLDPFMPAGDLNEEQRERLYRAIAPALKRAIELGAAAEYVEDLGPVEGISAKGDLMRVHNRLGKPCPKCGGRVQMKLLKGRNTFFCPACQRG